MKSPKREQCCFQQRLIHFGANALFSTRGSSASQLWQGCGTLTFFGKTAIQQAKQAAPQGGLLFSVLRLSLLAAAPESQGRG
jgi:hypothetical protein